MKLIRFLLPCLIITMLCQEVMAKQIFINKGQVRIPKGKSLIFSFEGLKHEGSTILLDVKARLDSDSFSGSMYFMKIALNGHLVSPAKTRSVTRLINRKLISPVGLNIPARWFGNQAWRVLYAPDFEGGLKFGYYNGNPYQTVLDVTDLVNPTAENRLKIFNVCKYDPPIYSKGTYDLVLEEPIIRVQSGLSPMITASTKTQEVINRGTPGAGPAEYSGKLMPGGGFQLSVAGQIWNFGSLISYPYAGINKLTTTNNTPSGCQTGYQVTVHPGLDGGQVIAEGPDYRITRTVQFTPRKVEIADQVTNLHLDAKLGLMFENNVKLEDTSARVRLAGIPDVSINRYYSPGNPSVYVALRNLGLGLICEDDVYRNQATLFFDPKKMTAGLRTDKLCLPAGSSYTLRWSIYPVASNDYYDFINLVRQDWGSNYTVEGAWTFFNPDSILAIPIRKLRNQFKRLGIKRACSWGGWVDHKLDRHRIGFGTGVLEDYWASYRYRLRRASGKIHQAVPECKVYVYYDTQRDTSEAGQERFKDSWLTDNKGKQVSTNWGGKYSLTNSLVATGKNSFGKAMLEAVDKYFEEMKIDGLYWDEMEGISYGKPLITYNAADGYSCELDPKTYAIRREIGINTIMGENHRIAVIKRVRALGGDLLGNGPTATKDILALHPQRMVEIQHNAFWNYEGNLDSPLGYASSRSDFGNWIRALNMATLLVGTRYDYEYDFGKYVFPFTPIELHAGYMQGKERIITTHSGNFGWKDSKDLVQVRCFDVSGKLVERDFKTRIDKVARTQVEVGKGEAVVLVKLPIKVNSTHGLITIHHVKYSPKGLSFAAHSSDEFTVEIHSGAMKVRPGQEFNLKIGTAHRTLSADGLGILIIHFDEMPSSQMIVIKPRLATSASS